MKGEIKEILEDIKRHLDYVEETKQASIRDNEMKAMYDYITNLQERIDNAVEYIEENIANGNELVFTQKGKWTTFQFKADNIILEILKGE